MRNFWIPVLILTILITSIAISGEYQMVRIYINSRDDLDNIARLGIDFEGSRYKKNTFLDVQISKLEKTLIENAGYSTRVLIDDLEQYYASRLITRPGEGFGFGSMGGFYTYVEVMANLDSMILLYPDLVSQKDTIGYSIRGKPIVAVKLSDNPNTQENEPEVLYTGLHHAREPASMMTIVYYMWHLLENYGSDPQAFFLLDNRQLWFVPMVNPDGYEHNQQTNPNGGGMWRLNARYNNDNGTYFEGGIDGVDLNRNYGYQWGYDNSGSSPTPGSQTYRGPWAFSEVETQTIRAFCNQHQFYAAFNYHTYSNLLIHPWAYNDSPTPDHLLFHTFGTDMTRFNGYTLGTPGQTVGYSVNGDSNDWMYGEQTTKPMILAYTPEVGNFSDGFWPSTNRIVPLAEENLYPNLVLSYIVGSYSRLYEKKILAYGQNSYLDPGEVAEVFPSITNFGLQSSDLLNVQLLPRGDRVEMINDNLNFPSMNTFDSLTASLPWKFRVKYNTPVGSKLKFDIHIYENGSMVNVDSLAVSIGTFMVAFSDDGENGLTQWTAGGSGGNWGTTSGTSHSPGHSLTDSPLGNYANNADFWISSQSIDLTNASVATLNYWTRWDIEAGWDFALVEISTNDGVSWNHLVGQYMTSASGSGVQTMGLHGYDGTQLNWVNESVDLSFYSGQTVQFRFRLASDGSVTGDGWFVDDIVLEVLNNNTNSPPYIQSVTNLNYQAFTGSPYPVEAVIYDDEGIDHTSLFYSTDNGSSYSEVPMIGSDSLFNGEIPALAIGTIVQYYVQTWDSAGAYSLYPYNAPSGTLTLQIVASGQPSIWLDPLAIRDTLIQSSWVHTENLKIKNIGAGVLTFNIIDSLFNGQNWLEIPSPSGAIPGNDSTNIAVLIDPAGLIQNTLYQAQLKIISNDPITPQLMVPVDIFIQSTSGITRTEQIPTQLALYANYPNPFNPNTTIAFDIPKPTPVSLEIFNILGQRVATLVNKNLIPGSYRYFWNAKNDNGQPLSSGIYFYQLKAGDRRIIKKMLLAK